MVVSCGTPASKGPSKDDTNLVVKPINFGHGVYYFPCTKKVYAVSLSAFLSDGTKHIKAMAGDATKLYGNDRGYFVVVEEK